MPGARVAIFGGPGEESVAAPVVQSVPADKRIDLVGTEDLPTVAACLKRCALFVGNDSGPAHIAAAFGVPTVVIFGSSNSAAWRPWKTPHAVVETAWDCKPCPGDRCYAFDEPRCILSVETAQVEAAIERLLAETGGARAPDSAFGVP